MKRPGHILSSTTQAPFDHSGAKAQLFQVSLHDMHPAKYAHAPLAGHDQRGSCGLGTVPPVLLSETKFAK
jgi:hypothetical protein